MPHHFLYLKNAYHILIIKPPLPRFYLYYIQKISAQLARYFPKITAHNSKERQVPRRGGGGVEWCGDPWVALVLSP